MNSQLFRALLCAASSLGMINPVSAAPQAPAAPPKTLTPRVILGPPAFIRVVTDKDNGGSFTLAPETSLIVRLHTNPSTGYGWNVLLSPFQPLTLSAAPRYTPDKVAPGMVGAGGVEEFSFSPKYLPGVSQSFYLRLMSLRAFSPGVAGATLYEIHVTIPPQWTPSPSPATHNAR